MTARKQLRRRNPRISKWTTLYCLTAPGFFYPVHQVSCSSSQVYPINRANISPLLSSPRRLLSLTLHALTAHGSPPAIAPASTSPLPAKGKPHCSISISTQPLNLRSKIAMGDASQSGFKPPPEFQEDARPPVIEPTATDSTELWLIQWPKDQIPDFDGEQISLKLQNDGQLGTFEASSGKSYDVVSLAAQEPKAMVFLSSATDSKIVGKITRRVSFVRYLEPSEVPKDDTKKLKELYERSSATSLTNSGHQFSTPAKSTRTGGGRASTHSSGRKSSLSEEKVRSKDSKSRSSQDSDHSQDKKSKKRKKHVV
ncbi:hypothetical protein L2E82_33187 [Cichorium intybus]|uniref:Uncharacterized protein n=1 Tax=Cichorium intybus TaxID=13427 RepID=A0ACB9BJI5_CICIN|nr:hypothetical protein L2E82_33187 [Cichorium intybus]